MKNATHVFGIAIAVAVVSVLATGTPALADLLYDYPMDYDPGWTTEGLWAFGTPVGLGGENGAPDPISGHTGINVYGYNLSGDYGNNMPELNLTSSAIDCSDYEDLHLSFWRWLGVEQPAFDHAYVRVSNDGSNWTTVWQNGAQVTDYSWVQQEFDISAVADHQPTVYLRWTMGTSDVSDRYCGWNIDDVQITGVPEPTTLTLLAFGGSIVALRRRR